MSNQDSAGLHSQVNGQRVPLCCANCIFLQLIDESGKGQCFRHPPQVIVLMHHVRDVQHAQLVAQQRPTKVRPTMEPTEFCGDFQPAPAGSQSRLQQAMVN